MTIVADRLTSAHIVWYWW